MIVAGFGFRQGVPHDSLAEAFARAAAGHSVDRLATLATKAEDLAAFARALGRPLMMINAVAMQQQTTLSQSQVSLAHKGTGSVAEATALAAAGAGAYLLGPRVISTDGMATCALAKGGNK